MPKISVIIPVYNVEKYLENCLNSLLNQTFKDMEIIIVNDGSKDGSQKIINNYKQKHKNIIAIEQENHGQGHARNLGIKLANAEYIMFLDSDDTLEENTLEEMYNEASKHNLDVVVCDISKIINNKKQYFKNYLKFCDKSNINFMLSHPGPVAKLYKKEIFIKNSIKFLENVYYEDLAMTPILSIYLEKISYINKPLYNYLIRKNSTMKQTAFNKKIDDIFKVMLYLEKELTNRKENKYNEELEFLNIEHLLYSASLRYLDYPIYKEKINKIIKIIKNKYPDWNKNKYYKSKSMKFKIICNLIYNKHFMIVKLLKRNH